MDNDKLEFYCIYCKGFVQKVDFDSHMSGHRRVAINGERFPSSLEEMEEGLTNIGYWEER